MGDDVLVMQPREDFAFCGQTVVVRDVAGDLENVLFVAAVLAHQQRVAGEPRPCA